ncbi:MAG: molybdenum cofactor guanylyltransferase [Alphaproteobacteria bacterium]|nr:molybdenum cofactor guanylyltransferase [Alphaproteobacteria bacterium]
MTKSKILGVVLAGGLSRRMEGGKKFLKKIDNTPIIDLVIKKVTNQVDELIINANENKNSYLKKFNVPIVPDIIKGFKGPLVGILSGMMWAKKQKRNFNYLATFPCDAPFFPEKLVKKLIDETKKNNFDIVIPRYKDQNHPVFGIWSLDLIDSLKKYLLDEDLKKIDTWIFRNKYKILNFKDLKYDPFFNINTVQELSKANSISSEFDI